MRLLLLPLIPVIMFITFFLGKKIIDFSIDTDEKWWSFPFSVTTFIMIMGTGSVTIILTLLYVVDGYVR